MGNIQDGTQCLIDLIQSISLGLMIKKVCLACQQSPAFSLMKFLLARCQGNQGLGN